MLFLNVRCFFSKKWRARVREAKGPAGWCEGRLLKDGPQMGRLKWFCWPRAWLDWKSAARMILLARKGAARVILNGPRRLFFEKNTHIDGEKYQPVTGLWNENISRKPGFVIVGVVFWDQLTDDVKFVSSYVNFSVKIAESGPNNSKSRKKRPPLNAGKAKRATAIFEN